MYRRVGGAAREGHGLTWIPRLEGVKSNQQEGVMNHAELVLCFAG